MQLPVTPRPRYQEESWREPRTLRGAGLDWRTQGRAVQLHKSSSPSAKHLKSPQAEARATPATVSNPSPNGIFLFQGSEQDREAAAEVDNGVKRLFDFLMTFIQTQCINTHGSIFDTSASVLSSRRGHGPS